MEVIRAVRADFEPRMDLPEFLHLPDSPWVGALAGALLVLAGSLLAELTGGVILLRLLPERSMLGGVLRHLRGPLRLALPLLALQFYWFGVDDGLKQIGRVRHLNALAVVFALTLLSARFVAVAAGELVKRYPYDVADNLQARRVLTQARVLSRSLIFLIVLIGAALGLMTFPTVRHLGTSLLASAGVAGLVIGLAAKSVLGNLLAGLQLALTQPIRYDDVLIVQGQWGRVEEITMTYVVVALWDERRLVVPLQWFIENPFENWTRTTSHLIGSVFWWVDYGVPLDPLRAELKRLCQEAPEWDGRVCVLQVTDTSEKSMQLRGLVSSVDSGRNWDLRCKVREGLIDWIRQHHPQGLPRLRAELGRDSLTDPAATAAPAH
ncbi:MAG TPA: mechanosensitive ion channel domain-containing protein [Nevskia sp.]|nr:mechanosensitive ion channel domain-containing protein [Nevskia sp.]